MNILKIITITSSILLLRGLSPALATTNEHIGYCDDIASIAGALECLSEHREKAEKDLQDTFAELAKDISKDQEKDNENKEEAGFLNSHKDWITYRNSECAWEAKTVDVSRSKLQEMACVIKLTEERTLLLQARIKSKKGPEQTLEFSAFPIWLNGLHNDYEDVIWDIKSQYTHDLNCDNKNETIIQGVSIKNKNEEKSGKGYEIKSYIAVIDGKMSGKPKITVLNPKQECGYMTKLEHAKTEKNDEPGCVAQINLTTCSEKIRHDDGLYKIEDTAETIEEK